MEELLNLDNAKHFDRVSLYIMAVLGMGSFFWLIYRIGMFLSMRSVAILDGILAVLKKLEISVEIMKNNQEIMKQTQDIDRARLTKLEDHVYGSFTKSTKR